jgi:protocatechuate 3,4-dioxygenase beta subunit
MTTDRAATLIVALAALTVGATANAQTIRGTVVDETGRQVPGVVVFMLDSNSAAVARSLSDERGAFRIAAPRAGSYRVRTMRIGYRPTISEPIALPLGGAVDRRIVLSGAHVALDTIRVSGHNSCRVTNDATGAATFAILDQVRTALSAAQLTLAGHNVRATTMTYDLTMDAQARRIVEQTSRTTTAYVTQAWRALSPDSSHSMGFVSVADDNSVTYYAPSIDVLASNVFVEDHCFATIADANRSDLIGVAFEPSGDRKVPEIKGTLWVNRNSAELQRLDYRYVNTSVAEDADAGGELSFARLRDGGWMISRWNIQMPVLEQVVQTQAFGGRQTHIAAYKVTGGEVQLATRARGARVDTLWSGSELTLSGTVVDSTRGTPVANARVDIVGTALSGVSDARGRFSISGVLPGTYSVETVTPDLDRIGAANESTITVSDTALAYQIRVPSASQLAVSICRRAVSTAEAAIIGRVRYRGDTIVVAGADVVAQWVVTSPPDQRGEVERAAKRLAAKASADGTFRLCGVPSATQISISAFTSQGSGTRSVFTGGPLVRADLTMELGLQRTATFAGRVRVDSLETPIEDAEVFFPDLAKLVRSRADGAFRVSGIPPGEQHVIVRHVGYGPLDTRLTFRADAVIDRDVFLSRSTVLDPVVVTGRATDRALADFEANRRVGLGHFLDRAELEKEPDAKLSRLVAQWPGIRLAFGTGGRVWITGTRKAPPPCAPGPSGRGCYESSGWYVPDQSEAQRGVKIACYAQVYIDDVLMNHGKPTPPFEANEIYSDQIEAIEWYAGPSETPARYAGLNSDCGVLVVHRRRRH